MKSKSLSFLIYSSTFLETLLPSLSSEGICLPCASTLCICVFFRPLWFLTLHPLWLPTVVPSTVSQGGTRSVSDGCWLMKGNENSSWSNDFWTLFVRLQMRIQETMSSTVPWCLSEDLIEITPYMGAAIPRGACSEAAGLSLSQTLGDPQEEQMKMKPTASFFPFWDPDYDVHLLTVTISENSQSWQHSVLSAESKASLLF